MKSLRIPFFAFSLMVMTNLVSSASAHAEGCKIAGISNPPQTISCKMRGIYFEKIEGRIECKNGQYYFSRYAMDGRNLDENHVTGAYHEDTTSHANLVFPIDEFGDSLVIKTSSGNRWKGYFQADHQTSTHWMDRFRCSPVINEN